MKVSFITGGATGIGKAAVEKLIKEGITVAFFDINLEESEKLLSNYSDKQILFIEGDVNNLNNLNRAVQLTHQKYGRIDNVFANAGIHRSNSIFNITEEEWDLVLNTNLKSMVFTVKSCIPFINEQNKGSVVLMGSDQSIIGKSNNLAYGASKGAIAQITKSLALDLAEKNINVNTICPGTIVTPLTEKNIIRWANEEFGGDVEEATKAECERFPVKRLGTVKEVANLVHFLAFQAGTFLTGTIISIDGGVTAN